MKKLNKKTALIGLLAAVFFLASLAVLLILPKKQKTVEQFDQFKDCGVLADSCKDKSCRYLFLCNETEFLDCKVYDCGDKYGIRILDKNGNVKEKTRQKPDQKKVQEMINRCRGSIEILETKECENGKAMASVKVATTGKCEINSFIVKIGDKNRIARFEKEGDVYNLSVKRCGEISEIMAVGDGGVQIKSVQKL